MAVKPYFLNFDWPVIANAKNRHAQMMSDTSTIQRNKYIVFPVYLCTITILPSDLNSPLAPEKHLKT